MNKSLTSIFKSPDKVPAEDMKSANRAERFFDIFSEYVSKSLMHDFDSVEPHIKHVVQSLEIAKKKTTKVTTPAHVDELFTAENMNFDALAQMCTRLDEISKMGSEFEDQWVKTSDKKKSNERIYFDAFQTFSEAKKEEKKREMKKIDDKTAIKYQNLDKNYQAEKAPIEALITEIMEKRKKKSELEEKWQRDHRAAVQDLERKMVRDEFTGA